MISIAQMSIQGLLNGSVSQPSLYFNADNTIGLYRPLSPNGTQFSWALNGAEAFNYRGNNISASSWCGLLFEAQNAGQGSIIRATSSSASEDLLVQAKGGGTLRLSATSVTGAVHIAENNEAVTISGNMHLNGLSYFDIDQIAVPAAPAAGTRRLFVSSVTGAISVETSAAAVLNLEAGAAPPGLNTQVVYNDAGVWGADANFTWNKATTVLTVPTIASHTVQTTLTVAATVGGSLLWFTSAAAQGGNIRFPANVASGLTFYDGTSTYYVINTQIGTDNAIGHSFRPAAPISYASAAGSTYSLVSLTAAGVAFTGGVGVTALNGMQLLVNAPSISSGVATVVVTASTVYIAGAPTGGGAGPASITNAYALHVAGGTSLFAGLISGTLGLTVTGATVSLNASSNFATNINTGTSTGAVNIGNSLAGVIAIVNKANTAATFLVTDGTTNLISLDTRNTATAAAITWTYTAPATMIINNAAGTTYSHVAYAALSYGLTNGTLVTAMKGLQLNLGVPTVTGALAVTVTDASTLYVAAPAVGGAGPSVITNSAAIAVGGNILPDADNSYSVGSAARRFSLVRATTITSGDLKLENDYYFTEAERLPGQTEPGIALCRPDGSLITVFR